jgi:hypothetical protein
VGTAASGTSYASCPSGYVALGGGYDVTGNTYNPYVAISAPTTGGISSTPVTSGQTPAGWVVVLGSSQSGDFVAAYVVCSI